ncbi:MAG TPA: SDR family NAD(P)-dependent oxidoreductase [Acidimicrobiales bacterium]
MKLQNQVALIFGGSSGIGRGSAEAMAADGATVVVADVDEQGGAEVVAGIEARGGRALFVSTDISDEDAVARAVATTVEQYGTLDSVVTSAGAGGREWHRGIDIFLKGPYYACRHAIPVMVERGGGTIINIGSVASLRGSIQTSGVDGTAYPMSKHAVLGLTKTLALTYGPQNVRVNCVCPGYVKTGLTKRLYESPESETLIKETLRVPLGRWGEPEDIGKVVAFLASDDAAYISGQAIVVDGGLTAR